MRFLQMIAVLGVFALSDNAYSGELTDKVDRFTGARSIVWSSASPKENAFSLSSFAFVPKGGTSPMSYFVSLETWSSQWQYLRCNHTSWLVNGEPASWIVTEYEHQMAGSATYETFSFRLTKPEAQRLANAKKVEYKVCNTEGAVSANDLKGLLSVITATD